MAGKRFTRYYQDPEFKAAIDEQFALAATATEPGVWITYAIHDPTQRDHIGGEPQGLIIYVGQSKEFGKRVRKRMRDAGTAVRRPTDRIDGACYDVMAKGSVPRFSVRETANSAIESLVSETNTAKRLLAAGYPLLNKWTEQRFGGLHINRNSVPHDWLWPITASDAIGSEIELIVRDTNTGQEISFDLESVPPNTRLRELRTLVRNQGGRQCRLYVR